MDRPPTPPSGQVGIVIVSPRISPTPPELDHDVDEESVSQAELLLASLASGESSRSRRLGPARTDAEPMQLVPPSLPSPLAALDQAEGTPEVSPEELRAARLAELSRTQEDERRSLQTDLEALTELRELRAQLSARRRHLEAETEEIERSVWRNEPIPVPRLSSLPRGGRTFPYSPSAQEATTTSTASRRDRDIFSPPPAIFSSSLPPPPSQRPSSTSATNTTTTRTTTSLPSFETLFARIAATANSAQQQLSSLSTSTLNDHPPSSTTTSSTNFGGGGGGISLRNYFLEPTHLVGDSFFSSSSDVEDFDEQEEQAPAFDFQVESYQDALDRQFMELDEQLGERGGAGGGRRTRELIYRTNGRNREGTDGGDSTSLVGERNRRFPTESGWTVVNRPFDETRRNVMERLPPEGTGFEAIVAGGRRRRNGEPTGSGQDQASGSGRSREETNSLAGRALRSKKGVYLIYCGGQAEGQEGETLPRGFSTDDGAKSGGNGCGALICARGLIEGVPKKVFTDGGEELEGFSSDLPPSVISVADLDEEGESEGLGQRVGKRGWKSCKGCVTRDLGCRRCGNHIGYRLLRPDVFCSIARDSAGPTPWRRPNDPSFRTTGSSAGGVTGGGVVDGLLFHFRKDKTTSVRRRIGLPPKSELSDETVDATAATTPAADSQESTEQAPGTGRLKEKVPDLGEEMIWKHIPAPQHDFEAGLVSEPLDWLTPNQETWWLENSISKHSYSLAGPRNNSSSRAGSNDRKRPAEEELQPHSTDTLSSATTTVSTESTRPRAGSGASLSRSPAIRLRVPLASSSSPSNTNTNATSSVNNYDRYRSEAQSYARRIRQRLNDHRDTASSPGATAAGAGSGVVGSLERAGYGSWYGNREAEETEQGDAGYDKRRCAKRARQSIGR